MCSAVTYVLVCLVANIIYTTVAMRTVEATCIVVYVLEVYRPSCVQLCLALCYLDRNRM